MSTKKHKNGARSGLIESVARFSCAIRYFAGGSLYNIALLHGILYKEVFTSVWRVVDTINATPELKITFPSIDKQKQISKCFMAKSDADFDNEHLNPKGYNITGVKLEIFCGRKSKFRLNMMRTVDNRKQFVDINILHPGATSDYLAFSVCSLKERLESGLLAAGLCISGNNAYPNTRYMATPFQSPKSDEENYIFYLSQIHINVECAFGMLVQR